MDKKYKFYLTASMTTQTETEDLKKEVASVIHLPDGTEKQPDLSYFSSIFVSSGENLNHAYFLSSELVSAADTITSKALDIEHEEQEIIGHLFSYAFTNKEHQPLDIKELASTETATLDSQDMHIQVGSIVYKNRFPEITKEIANGDWSVSMECYYTDYDVKVGSMIIPRAAAHAVGLDTTDNSIYGKFAKVIKNEKEIASGTVARVLRGICFSGCGIVKNPANPPSVILETASSDTLDAIIIDLTNEEKSSMEDKNKLEIKEVINVTSKEVEDKKEIADLNYNDSVGICVSYKRRLLDKQESVLAEDWCSEYSQSCTSFSRDAHDQACLKNVVNQTATNYLEALLKKKYSKGSSKESLKRLQLALEAAKRNL